MSALTSTTPALQPRQYRRGPFTVQAAGYKKLAGETIPRRHPTARDKLISVPEAGVETVFDIVRQGAIKYGKGQALGSRKVIKIHRESKTIKKRVDGQDVDVVKEWQYFELSPYSYMTFTEYEQLVLKIGSALRKLGMSPGDRIQLFAATSAKWLATAHGACSQSMAIVTAYDTLGPDALKHSISQTGASAIFLDGPLLTTLVKPLHDLRDVKYVIYNKHPSDKEFDPAAVQTLQSAHPNITIIEFDDLVTLGEQNMVDPVPPKADDLCCIMYTSGSTGTPKGVLLQHRNVVGAVAGIQGVLGPYLSPGEFLLTYLPLAHILEFAVENACLYLGATMGYGNPKTISDASVRNCAGDIREFRPSILVGVPAVWETVKKGILARISGSSALIRYMFWGAMAAKSAVLGSGLPGSDFLAGILDKIVFNKVRQATGGRLKVCFSGGAPVSKETQRFISMAIAPMVIGYGLTETTAMGALMDPAAWCDNALGEVPPSMEVKLVSYKDAGYDADSNPPQGEIWIRGAAIATGYLNLEKETREAFTDDGWFMTGDIGEFDEQGHLKIIDRKKNLVKMLHGEYIAVEKLESIYRSADFVANLCIHADPSKPKPIAIVSLNEAVVKKLTQQNNIEGATAEELATDKKLNAIALKRLQDQGKKGGLTHIEIIDGVVLVGDEWTPQNGFVTSAQKLNRKVILNRYKASVDRIDS